MIIRTPYSLEGYFRSTIIKRLKLLNPQFDYPNVASWQAVRPTLEEPVSREVIELELKNLESAWQRCLKLTRNGATRIHLVLHPKLYAVLKKNKLNYIVENPISNLKLYELPKRERKERKTAKKNKTKSVVTTKITKETKAVENDEEDVPEDTDLEEYWAKHKPEEPKQLFTNKHCVDYKKFKVENGMGICPKYKWEIALDLAERDAVCEEL